MLSSYLSDNFDPYTLFLSHDSLNLFLSFSKAPQKGLQRGLTELWQQATLYLLLYSRINSLDFCLAMPIAILSAELLTALTQLPLSSPAAASGDSC